MSIYASILTTFGLVLDIAGVIMLFCSLSSRLMRMDKPNIMPSGPAAFADRRRKCALWLIILGFVLQGVAVWV